ncbi:MAG TPA: presqualene diphosphate synthase HpnD [Candidatus Eisenbacteria bacterium]
MTGRPTSFGVAFALLPAPQRDAIRAVHAWSRAVDDAVDEEADPERARARLAHWRDEIRALYDGTPGEPATRSLGPHVGRFGIPRGYLEELVSGVEMDLTRFRYGTFEDLRAYCYRVASVVGLICLRIFGEPEERARAYAENLGLALQLTNIVRDVGSDLARGRIYIPADELDRFGVSEERLLRRERDGAFLSLMRFQSERARSFFEVAGREVRALDRRRLLAAEIMAGVYRRLLDRIEASGFDVLGREVRVPLLERAWIAASTAIVVHAAR